AYPGVIAVGASACLDNGTTCTTEYVASYSNGGPGLGIVAPGGDPSGSGDNDNFHWIDNLSSPNNTSFPCHPASQPDGVCSGQFAGTSQATPHVAGAAALILALNPSMTPAQVAQLIYDTADNLPGIDPSYQGKGRLNVARALAKLTGDSSFPAYRPAPNQFVAFAYTNSGATNAAPAILDLFYTGGVAVNPDGTFRIADINPAGAYKIGVWYDANGNGIVDAGDYFGASGPCSTSGPCAASGILPVKLTSNAIP
ncbi:MAG: S8 family serine peptidase, partial [Candidatus Eremiobacteraeota bacterium]|nr:S8 family serine peptidase [Candidatus Eremiobacteraeota bacterium]